MQRFRATLAYDGTRYSGFQRQAGDTPTIQGAVEAALHRISGQHITIMGAGRTDAGVHASGQVIAFDLAWRHQSSDLLRALNANLPTDIALQTIAPAVDFHPRFDARQRTYVYRFYQSRIRNPLWDRSMWQIVSPAGQPLDEAAMHQAAALLVGEYDFSTFGQPTQPGGSPVRQVIRSSLTFGSGAFAAADQGAPTAGGYTITANAFLQRMVRSIMGTLAQVGRGAMDVETFEAALLAADRSRAGPTAPPQGLTLVSVTY